jgi:HD-GYP domain-containing protein (c-di-GMP phosphodiesterase class II)
MVNGRVHVDIFDLVTSIAGVVDAMSSTVADHHMKVAYLAYRIGEALGVPEAERQELAMAGALHDIGAFSLQERLDLLAFEDKQPGRHSMAGYLLLKDFEPFSSIAAIIKYHHEPWRDGAGATRDGEPVPQGSHIIHLADRVAVRITPEAPILSQVPTICDAIEKSKHTMFVPEYVDAMRELAARDYLWMEVTSNSIEYILQRCFRNQVNELQSEELLNFSRLICRLIDFKSEFTATHSSGVAATAVALARLAGFSGEERKLVETAAYLHDLGKLAIPSEIIEKPGKLTDDEWYIMRSHVYYTYRILEPIDFLGLISSWSALHQERLNGTGYPFGYRGDELPLGSRIMAVADVFTAITEDRPYRTGMSKAAAKKVLQSMADKNELDKNLVSIALTNFDELNQLRASAQDEAAREYLAFKEKLEHSTLETPVE